MEESYLTYRKFNDQAAAAQLAEVLQENGVEFELEDSSLNFDASFSYSELNKEFRVKIKREDFKKADELIYQDSLKAITEVADDYYLFQFTDQELEDLLSKADEWGPFDLALAQQILSKRGKNITAQYIEQLKAERLIRLAQPEPFSRFWLYTGYLFAFMGGLLGIVIGWQLISHRKTLPDGSRHFAYTSRDRKHGDLMLIIGCIDFVAFIIYGWAHR